MFEVPRAGEDHGQAEPVGRGDDLRIPDAPPGLDHGGHTGLAVKGATVNPRFPVPDEPTDIQVAQMRSLDLDPDAFRGRVLDVRRAVQLRKREIGRDMGYDYSAFNDDQLSDVWQYNLFPNTTIIAFPDLLQVVKSRPGPTPDECFMDMFVFERAASGSPRTPPMCVTVQPGDLDFGMVINQDVEALSRVQRGLHQPGFTELVLSGEECRIVNLHRHLEHFLGISPSEILGG